MIGKALSISKGLLLFRVAAERCVTGFASAPGSTQPIRDAA